MYADLNPNNYNICQCLSLDGPEKQAISSWAWVLVAWVLGLTTSNFEIHALGSWAGILWA